MRTLELNDKEQKCPWCDFFSNFTISCDGIQCGVLLGEVVEKKKLKLKFRKILWVRIPQNNLIMSINTDFFFALFYLLIIFEISSTEHSGSSIRTVPPISQLRN